MASPRVFVSSTFYDLRHVRADLERFIMEMGYEAVLHERGGIPYGSEEALEEYCYREIGLCDILVSVVGGRFGTRSRKDEESVSQKELKTALKLGRQVYIFVERAVLTEYRTWDLNRDKKDLKYHSVDHVRVFEFLAEVYALPNNNSIFAFDDTAEICHFLKSQWAGLFQRFLNNAKLLEQAQMFERLTTTVATLERLVDLMADQQTSQNDEVSAILLLNHPAFNVIKNGIGTSMRIAFYNLSELEGVMEAFRFEPLVDDDSDRYHQWCRRIPGQSPRSATQVHGIQIDHELFDEEGKLQIVHPGEWREGLVKTWRTQVSAKTPAPAPAPYEEDDDDLPF